MECLYDHHRPGIQDAEDEGGSAKATTYDIGQVNRDVHFAHDDLGESQSKGTRD